MESRIKTIMANVFLIDESEIKENASPDSIPQWDSIGHLNLITSLEEEFDIIFSEEQIIEMLNLPLVIEITREAVNSK
jgi:acyl carrier protein